MLNIYKLIGIIILLAAPLVSCNPPELQPPYSVVVPPPPEHQGVLYPLNDYECISYLSPAGNDWQFSGSDGFKMEAERAPDNLPWDLRGVCRITSSYRTGAAAFWQPNGTFAAEGMIVRFTAWAVVWQPPEGQPFTNNQRENPGAWPDVRLCIYPAGDAPSDNKICSAWQNPPYTRAAQLGIGTTDIYQQLSVTAPLFGGADPQYAVEFRVDNYGAAAYPRNDLFLAAPKIELIGILH